MKCSKCFYPNSLILNGAHHPFASCLEDQNFELLEQHLVSWLSECGRYDAENIIISTENLEYAKPDQLLKLKTLADRYFVELNAIIYIRPQSDLLISQYSQQVREGAYLGSLDSFISESILYADYLKIGAILDSFSNAMESRLQAVFYYNHDGSPINVVEDFASRLRIVNLLKYTDSSTYSFNQRLSYAQLEFIKEIVQSCPELVKLPQYDRSQVLYTFIEQYAWPDFLEKSKKIELPREIIEMIYCQYKDENARISGAYLESPAAINQWYQRKLSHSKPSHLVNSSGELYDHCQHQSSVKSAVSHIRRIANQWISG